MGDEIRAAKRRRITNNIITITVGQGAESETFLIHDFLLKENSKFFEAALNRQWIEGQEKKVNLPDDNPEIFSIYADWLFTGKIASAADKNAQKATKEEIWHEQHLHSQLYVLGEKLIDDKFCDCTLRAMVELTKARDADGKSYWPGADDVCLVYKGTMEGSPVRKFLVDLYCQHIKKDWFSEDHARKYPKDFFIDIVKKGLPLLNGREGQAPGDNVERYLKCK